jgi:protein involved in temperature-dependent protein secretion
VFLPSIYVAKTMTAAQRLGHVTEFDDTVDRVALGKGLRTFLVGDDSKTIRELSRITFTQSSAGVN